MLIDIGRAYYLRNEPLDASTDHLLSNYVAPECYQAGGQVDVRADLYSLGVILSEMLNKKQITDQAPDMPPVTVSTALNGLLKLAMRADPARRLQSAAVFYLALERAYDLEERQLQQLYSIRVNSKRDKIFADIYEGNETMVQSLRALRSGAAQPETRNIAAVAL